jgi:hypothetical protein
MTAPVRIVSNFHLGQGVSKQVALAFDPATFTLIILDTFAQAATYVMDKQMAELRYIFAE